MKKSIITMLFTIVVLSILTTLVYGADSQITINGDGTLKPGEKKELTINISSDEEIGIVSGKIEASSNITNMTVTGVNNWNLTYNNVTGEFNIYKAEGAKVQDIITIEYEVGTEEGTGTITLSNIKMTTISYESKEIGTITKDITIANEQQNIPETPTVKTITGISITKAPTKTTYSEGEDFDKTGMEVIATYNDGTSKEITDYLIIDENSLTAGKTNVTISYTEGNITKTVEQSITVVSQNKDEDKQQESNKNEEQEKDSTTANEDLPKTGTSENVFIIALLSLSVVSIVAYIKYRKYKNI